MANQYTGKIILIDRIRGFGFIESANPELHIFFPKSSALAWSKLEIYDEVQFEIFTSTIPRYIGQPYAGKVTWPKGYEPNIEKKYGINDRWVGKMTKWDGQKGYIEVSTLSKRIYLKHTTLAHCRLNRVGPGSLFVVNPVKSTKPHSEYFALFAYSLALETNPNFLQEAWEKNDEQGILDAIEERLYKTGHTDRLWQMYCDRYLKDLGKADRMREIIDMIDRFQRWGFEPNLNDLDKAAAGNLSILLILWIQKKTKYFKPDEVLEFFNTSSDHWRGQILDRLGNKERIHFLKKYSLYLAKHGQLNTNTPRLRYVLQTAKRYGDSVWNAIWSELKIYLEKLSLEDKVQLWTLGLFNDLDLGGLLSQISLEDTGLWLGIINRKSEQGESLTKIILDLFLEKTDRKRFEGWYAYFIPVMRAVSKKWPELAATVRPRLRQLLAAEQLLTLGLLGLKDYLEENADFQEAGGGRWPMYALVRYALQKKIAPEEMRRLFLAYGFSAERLLSEIPDMPWSQILQPCRTKPEVDYEIGYLEDVAEACRLAEFPEVQIFGESSLSTCIFESVKTMEPFHARLWLNEFVPREYYDYQGFKEPFKKLSREEKKLFVRPSQKMMEDTVDVQVMSEMPACHDYKENGNGRIYLAKIKNIHFENNKFQLKTPDGFTSWADLYGITYSLNFISGNQYYDSYNIEIHVQDNTIIKQVGLDQIISEISRMSIESSLLNKNNNGEAFSEVDPPYTDDLQLQEQILHYLKSNQDVKHNIVLINPHIFDYESFKNDKLGLSRSRLVTGIFTIKLENAYFLVWEFFELNKENATYVFKASFDDYEKIINRLINTISTRSGVRAALNTSQSQQESQVVLLEKFRQGLGYVANFKIKRGVKGAFKSWERKLKEKFVFPIPPSISDREWENVLNDLKLEDSRRTGPVRTKKHPPSKESQPNYTDDEQVKTASDKTENIFNTKGGNPDIKVEKDKEMVSKIQNLNNLLTDLLS
jgi:hypothetical protein